MLELPVDPPHLQVVEQHFLVVVGGAKYSSRAVKFAGHYFLLGSLDLNGLLLADIPKSQAFI